MDVVNASSPRIQELQEHIRQLHSAVTAFERTTAHLRERRRGATDHVMIELDERLLVNERTLECIKRSLELAQLELARAERESTSPFSELSPRPRPNRGTDPAPDRLGGGDLITVRSLIR